MGAIIHIIEDKKLLFLPGLLDDFLDILRDFHFMKFYNNKADSVTAFIKVSKLYKDTLPLNITLIKSEAVRNINAGIPPITKTIDILSHEYLNIYYVNNPKLEIREHGILINTPYGYIVFECKNINKKTVVVGYVYDGNLVKLLGMWANIDKIKKSMQEQK